MSGNNAATLRRYREDHRQEIASWQKQWRDEHREEISDYMKSWYQDNRESVLARLRQRQDRYDALVAQLICESCGAGASHGEGGRWTLHFHHRDPETKVFNVGGRVTLSWQRLLAEIEKCDVLCTSCHAGVKKMARKRKKAK